MVNIADSQDSFLQLPTSSRRQKTDDSSGWTYTTYLPVFKEIVNIKVIVCALVPFSKIIVLGGRIIVFTIRGIESILEGLALVVGVRGSVEKLVQVMLARRGSRCVVCNVQSVSLLSSLFVFEEGTLGS